MKRLWQGAWALNGWRQAALALLLAWPAPALAERLDEPLPKSQGERLNERPDKRKDEQPNERLDTRPGRRLVELGGVRLPVQAASWKDFRDRRVVKQEHDFSCGAASLATILRHYYQMDVDEAAVLDTLALGDYAASFHDLAKAAEAGYGLRTLGLAADFAALQQLKLPVIVFLDIGDLGHFAVLRGIDGAGKVWLADPSHGNQLYAKHQFLRIWSLEDESAQKGRLLAILPPQAGEAGGADLGFFVSKGLAQAMRP